MLEHLDSGLGKLPLALPAQLKVVGDGLVIDVVVVGVVVASVVVVVVF